MRALPFLLLLLAACTAESATFEDIEPGAIGGKADGTDDSDEPFENVASPAAAGSRPYAECETSTCYWLVVYSSQKGRNPRLLRAGYSHTFAQFVAVEDGAALPESVEAGAGQANPIEINWMPEDAHRRGYIGLLRGAEPGVNWPVLDTLELSGELGRDVSMWGPVRVTEDLYRAAAQMRSDLDGGLIEYDAIHRPGQRTLPNGEGRTHNCLQAVSDVDVDSRGTLLRFGNAFGEDGSRLIGYFFKQYMIGPRRYGPDEAHIARLLGLYDVATPITPRTAELDRSVWLRVHAL